MSAGLSTDPSVRPGRAARHLRVPAVLAAVTILGQIAWVLVPDSARTGVTVLTVTTFLLATLTHAWLTRGARWMLAYLAVSAGLGWAVEAIGTATSWPFGTYAYTSLLGWQVLAVPLVIPMAWAMMAYPCLLAARRLTTSPVWTPLVGGWLLAAWDLFLDPQMVGEGYWAWQAPFATLPGIDGIPAQNFAGWLLVAVVMMAALDRLPRTDADDRVPAVLLSWVYLSSVLSSAAFFGRPAVAAWGAACMGAVIVPWWLRLRRGTA